MSDDISIALDSLLQTAGLGGFGPNTVLAAWPNSWQTNIVGAKRMIQVRSYDWMSLVSRITRTNV